MQLTLNVVVEQIQALQVPQRLQGLRNSAYKTKTIPLFRHTQYTLRTEPIWEGVKEEMDHVFSSEMSEHIKVIHTSDSV